MRPKTWSFTPAAASTTGLASSVTGASFTLTASSAGDSLAHQITITNLTVNTHVGQNMTIVGTDANGGSYTETITGPGGSATVTTTGYFLTVTSVTPSATIGADTFSIGWNGVSTSNTFVPDYLQAAFSMGLGCTITGTINYSLQHTFSDPFAVQANSAIWFAHSTIASKTANQDGNYAAPVRGIRLLVNSVTAGATIKVTFTQGSV